MPKNYNLHLKGYVGDWDFCPDMVSYILDKNKDKQVNVLIDSLGGMVDAALSISALFKNHGDVHCHYVGMSASAATIASMGAKRITIDRHALFLVHKCLCPVIEWDYLNADELAAHIADLQKMKKDNETIDGCIAGLYASRCKKTTDELLQLMTEGAWLTAQQALDWGFVDEITDDPADAAPVMTDKVADFMAAEGIPMPQNLSVKKGSFLERLLNLFSQSSKPAAEPPTAKPSTNIMPKTFAKLAALLGVAVAIDESNPFALDEAQADSLEAALSERDQTVADLTAQLAERDATIAGLKAKIAELSREPADSTGSVAHQGETAIDNLDKEKLVDALLKNI